MAASVRRAGRYNLPPDPIIFFLRISEKYGIIIPNVYTDAEGMSTCRQNAQYKLFVLIRTQIERRG